jgi:hypothetical protein
MVNQRFPMDHPDKKKAIEAMYFFVKASLGREDLAQKLVEEGKEMMKKKDSNN